MLLLCDTIQPMLKRACLLAVCVAGLASGALLRIELSERSDVLGGKSFGSAGPYERLIGKAYFAVDPANPANRIISDIDKAPRNEKGLVEFSADLYVLKPRDPAHGNRAALFEVSNRGTKGMLSMYNRAAGSLDPRAPEQFGDEFLLERGLGDLAGKGGVAASRLYSSCRLLARAGAYRFVLGRNIQKNTRCLLDFLRRADG